MAISKFDGRRLYYDKGANHQRTVGITDCRRKEDLGIEEDKDLFVSDELNERGWEVVITDWKIENELVIEEIEE